MSATMAAGAAPLNLADLPPDELAQLVPLIRDTPAVDIGLPGVRRPVRLKLEGALPGGSSKDRTAKAMTEGLPPGGKVTDSTSGNLGVSLAWLARARRLALHAVTDPRCTPENQERMRRLGAVVEVVDERDETGGYLLTRIRRAREVARSDPGRVTWLNQYAHPGNPAAHAAGTAPEALRQMRGSCDFVFAPGSTGGTLAGFRRFLDEASPRTQLVAVDGMGSDMLGPRVTDERLVNGLGAPRRSDFFAWGDAFRVVRVPAVTAFAYCWALAEAGIWVGGSSGAAVAAAAQVLREFPGARALCVCPDRGEAYRTTVYDPAWLEARGLRLEWRGLLS